MRIVAFLVGGMALVAPPEVQAVHIRQEPESDGLA